MEYLDEEAKAKLICQMEVIIARHCYNKNFNMGYYRYPICYTKDGISHNVKGYYYLDLDIDDIPSMHYEFGSNRIDIGDALIEVLEFLKKYSSFDYYYTDDPDDY